MQPIERYGLISFLFIVVSALAVYLWDAEPLPEEPGGEQVARGEDPARGDRETEATRRAEQLANQRAARGADKPGRNAGAPQGSGVGLAVGSAERGGQGNRAQSKAPKPATNSGLAGTPQAGVHPSVSGAQPQRPGGASQAKVPTATNNLPKFSELKDAAASMSPAELAAQATKNRALQERAGGSPSGTLSGPNSPKPNNATLAEQTEREQPKAKLASEAAGAEGRKADQATQGTVWTVAAGETLGDISLKHYGSTRYWDEILAANPNASEHRLQVNQKLLLPVIDTAPAKGASVAANTTAAKQDKQRVLQADEIEVAAGDTLSEIAQKHLGRASRWQEIADLNPRANPNALQVGMVLKLPQAAARLDVDSSKLTASRSADSAAEDRTTYGRVR
ncbi:MAG: LysM peptidoglycan-binding domain-containing protein [Planctomycetota bacterium]|jgi:nucleoid-associated protein YgaU